VFFLTNALCGCALANPPLILVIRPPQHMAGRETTQPHPDTQTTILRPLAKISKAAVKEENCARAGNLLHCLLPYHRHEDQDQQIAQDPRNYCKRRTNDSNGNGKPQQHKV